MDDARSRFVIVDGIRTHYWEAGEGPVLVLLHAGGYGENAERSWHRNVAALAAGRRVVAPDWLGFGKTDKIRDFTRGNARMLDHLVRFLEVLDIDDADFCGLSMGGTFLVKAVATGSPVLPVRRMILVSGGGFPPLNDARRKLQEYDGTLEAMRVQLQQVIHAPLWQDDAFVTAYWEASLEPGQWEFVSAPRLRASMKGSSPAHAESSRSLFPSCTTRGLYFPKKRRRNLRRQRAACWTAWRRKFVT